MLTFVRVWDAFGRVYLCCILCQMSRAVAVFGLVLMFEECVGFACGV